MTLQIHRHNCMAYVTLVSLCAVVCICYCSLATYAATGRISLCFKQHKLLEDSQKGHIQRNLQVTSHQVP